MVRPADVHEALLRSPVPLGAGALAETLGSHWGIIAEILISLERQGSIVRQGHGWVAAPQASFDRRSSAASGASPGANAAF